MINQSDRPWWQWWRLKPEVLNLISGSASLLMVVSFKGRHSCVSVRMATRTLQGSPDLCPPNLKDIFLLTCLVGYRKVSYLPFQGCWGRLRPLGADLRCAVVSTFIAQVERILLKGMKGVTNDQTPGLILECQLRHTGSTSKC